MTADNNRLASRSARRRRWAAALAVASVLGIALAMFRDDLLEKRVVVLEPGKLFRAAWQRPWPLRRIVARERIRTIVTLTAINRDDPKYVDQERVVRDLGVGWIIVPMRGSRATLAQMAEAADLLADPRHQPVLFHCVAGHHRSNLVHAAYRIRHDGWSAKRAWEEVSGLPWSRPSRDQDDQRLIEAFAAEEASKPPQRERKNPYELAPSSEVDRRVDRRTGGPGRAVRGDETIVGKLRDG